MSVMEADEQDRGTILHYAPRHVRLPAEERSIRPILERLSRGESDGIVGPQRQPEPARLEQTIPLEMPRPRIGRQILLCSLLSAGLSAGLVVLATGWFAPAKTEATRFDTVQLDPKSVRTVSFKPETPVAATTPTESDLQKQAPEAAPPIQPKDPAPPSKPESRADQIAPKELLALWSGIPADVSGSEAVAEAAPPAPADVAETARDEVEAVPTHEAPPPARTHRHHSQAHRRTQAARGRSARAQHRAQPAPAATQNADAAPLQSALQSLFSRSASAPQQAQQQP